MKQTFFAVALGCSLLCSAYRLPAVAAPATGPGTGPATGPAGAPAVEVQADGSLLLKAEGARIHGFRLRLDRRGEPELTYWIDREEYPEWPQAVAKKGTYAVELTYACPRGAGGDFAVVAAAHKVAGSTQQTADWKTFRTVKLPNLQVLNDATSISLRCNGRLDHALMSVRSIKLTPIADADKRAGN